MQHVLGAHEHLGPLIPGPRPLMGKSFYLDDVKSHLCSILTKHIIRLGGRVESFLYKDVNVVITGNRDTPPDIAVPSSGKVKGHSPPCEQREIGKDVARRPGTLRAPVSELTRTSVCARVCGSRGKALLEKAIRDNEQSRGGVLSSAAHYWGVKILSVDQILKVLEELNSHCYSHTLHRGQEKNFREPSSVRVVRAGSLKVDFVKVEDSSRRYRPLHSQSLEFPMLSYTRRFSPFENPAPVHPVKGNDVELNRKSQGPISFPDKETPSCKVSRRKKSTGFCECCQVKYKDQDKHLQSDVHRHFVENGGNYAVVDDLVVAMDAIFSECKDPHFDTLVTRSSHDSVAPPSGTCHTDQQVKVEECSEHVCVSSFLHQEPQEPPSPEMDEKRKGESHPPRPQDGFVLDSKSLEPSPGVSSCDHNPGTPQEHAEGCLRPVGTLPNNRGPSNEVHQGDLNMNMSDAVNPRKRRRSFSSRLEASKARRTSLSSELADQNSGVDVINGDMETNDVTAQELNVSSVLSMEALETRLSIHNGRFCEKNDTADVSSELGPPLLYPFFHDDVYQTQPPLPNPPELTPSFLRPHSFSSIIESSLVPNTFSPASSESDWDSGLLSRFAPPRRPLPTEGHGELDLGLLLQSSCSGMQDGSYASRLYSVLQPAAAFGDPEPIYRPMEAVDRRVIQSLEV